MSVGGGMLMITITYMTQSETELKLGKWHMYKGNTVWLNIVTSVP